MNDIARTPEPPYWAVIFTSRLRDPSPGYDEMADRMAELARVQPGFLGFETARSDTGITVSYWESEDAIRQWKRNAEHLEAQRRGRAEWYESFVVRVCRVERAYGQPDLTQRL